MNTTPTPEILLQQIARIQRMERGTLSVLREGANGPCCNFQRWEAGRNVSQYVPADQVPLVRENLDAYAQFDALIEQYVQLLSARSREERRAGVKKKTADTNFVLAKEAEIEALMVQFAARTPTGDAVQQLEVLLRTALFKPANALLEHLLQEAVNRIDATYQAKPGQVRKGRAALVVQGIFGSITLQRDYYYHPGKAAGHYPADCALGLEGAFTPALARLMCLEGADESSFEKASSHLQETGGITVSGRQIQRVVQRVGAAATAWQKRESASAPCDAPIMYVSADGTGVPVRRCELEGRRGKQSDGTSKTRMVYLGCVFTQHKQDEKGHPLRDYESTTYVSSFDAVDDFGIWLRREALRRGMGGAKQTVLLIDGASGLEKLGQNYFPGCVQIVDFYHALEHLEQVVGLLWEKTQPEHQKQRSRWVKQLLKDGVTRIIQAARAAALQNGQADAMEKALGYFEHNVARMQYGSFRRRGFFIGSGVIEAGCKTVVGSRCKQSGMFWSTPGAEKIIAFRCIHQSHRLTSFWKDRLNQRAAANDSLRFAA